MLSNCEAELCHHWTGAGCACGFLGLEPAVTCRTCGSICPGDGKCEWCDEGTHDE